MDINKKIDLTNVLKRYILRFSSDKNYLSKNLNNNIALELDKPELWILNENLLKNYKENIMIELERLNINASESFSLYKKLEKKNNNIIFKNMVFS